MPGRNDALTAARFEITIDGHSFGRFETLFAAIAPGAAPRALLVHELPQLWQHTGEYRPGKVAQTDYHFDIPSTTGQPGRHAPSTITLRRGIGQGASHWHALRRRSVALIGLGPAGWPIVRYGLSRAWIVKIVGPAFNATGGGDVAIEEIVISHEGVCLVPSGGCPQRMISKP
jgi:hypothetical protein